MESELRRAELRMTKLMRAELNREKQRRAKEGLVFPSGSERKASACNLGVLGSIPGLGRSPGEGSGSPLQYSGLENSMDRGAWWDTVHGVSTSRSQRSNFTFTFHIQGGIRRAELRRFVLAWRITGMGEPGGLPSVGSHRVGHD